MNTINYIKEFKGGSMAKTFLIEQDNQLFVRKVVENVNNDELGVSKLAKQAKWILELEKDIRNVFPKIIDLNFNETSGYYTMEFCDMPTFRDFIINNQHITPEVEDIIKNYIYFGAKIAKQEHNSKIDGVAYIKHKHIEKMYERCAIVNSSNKTFNKLFNAPKLIINGKEYLNFKKLANKILRDKLLLELLAPKNWYRSHGDLTLQNLLTNGRDFKIIDPRGEDADTIYYDISKLYQSVDGKYDLLYKGNYSCNYDLKTNKIGYIIKENEQLFEQLYNIVKQHIPKVFNLEPQWNLIARFYEASHFIAMVPFRYKENLEITIMCYAIGIKIMNEVLEEWNNLK